MKVIYLDQNAACFLAKEQPEPIWREIRDGLEHGVRSGKLVCPLPFETVIETAARPLQLRQEIQGLFWRLSNGVAFKPFPDISSELTLALIRPTGELSPLIGWRPIWAEMEGPTQSIKLAWKETQRRMMDRMLNSANSRDSALMSQTELIRAIAAQRSLWVCDDLDRLLSGQINDGSLNCPWLIEYLLSKNINPAEVESLKRAVQHRAWAKIPLHFLDILIGAKWEYDLIRGGAAPYKANDEIDRMRSAIALCFAEVFVTEGDLANLCCRAKTHEYCSTRVLSARNPESVLEVVRSIAWN